MIKKIKPAYGDPNPYCGNCPNAEQEGFVNALIFVGKHINKLRDIYLGNHQIIAVLDRLAARIAEDTK